MDKFIVAKLIQALKHDTPILSRLLPIVTLVRLEHLTNVAYSNVFILLGSITSDKLMQSAKACSPILSTPSPNINVVKFSHL